jgi:hypothetical protein
MVLALIVSVGLTACTLEPPTDPVTSVKVEPQFSFFASGSASKNLPIFQNILEVTGAGKPGHDLSTSIALLVETGFEIEDMTHTPINSKIGEPADSVSLAIAFNDECLMAQFSSSWLTTAVAEPTVSGCLIGDVEKASLDNN